MGPKPRKVGAELGKTGKQAKAEGRGIAKERDLPRRRWPCALSPGGGRWRR